MRPVLPLLVASAAVALMAAGPAGSYAVSGRIAGPDGGWDLLSVDASAHRLYVARSTAVMAVDLATGAVTPSLVPLQGGHGVVAIPGGNRVLADSGAAGTATLFEGDTGKVIATLPTGKRPDAIAYDPATRTAWVFNPGSQDATVIDPAKAGVVATVPIGGSLELGVADGQGRMFVNVEDRNEFVAIDTRARKVLGHYPLQGCDGPTGIAYDAAAKRVLSVCANGVAIVSTPEGRLVASLKIGPRPDGAAFDEKRRLVLVPSGGDGTLSLIRLSGQPSVIGAISTEVGARTIALDAITGAAYLPSAQYGPKPATGRAPMLPGTFSVLVVKPDAP